MEKCRTCLSLSGVKILSPGPPIYEGKYWVVEHVYPTIVRGWMVIVLKRHAEALHELLRKEFIELAEIQYRLAHIMGQNEKIQKEYMFCTSEGEQFSHIHIHFVPKPVNLPEALRGSGIFMGLNVSEELALPVEDIIAISQYYREQFLQT